MSTSATSNSSAGFNGTSSFSTDFQSVITRAVAIANLPITQLQNQQSSLTSQQSELQTLGSKFTSLQTALSSLDTTVASGSLSASVDVNTVVSASIGTGALAGSYAVKISNLGSQSNTISAPSNSTTLSTASVADPTSASLSSSSTFTLNVGTATFSLTPAGNNLDSLATAINNSGANVQASVVNTGTALAPSYQLSIKGAANGNTVTLGDGTTTNLLGATTTASTGVLAIADPATSSISTSSNFTLTVGTATFSLTPGGNLNSLVKAINSSGANVQATLVNVGGSVTPNYELSIQGTQYSNTSIQLNDGTNDLLTTLTNGSPVTYQVNGEPATSATSTSRALSISTGLTVNALTTGTANVTVAQTSGDVQNALSSLVASFNAATDELTKNHGQGGGALVGQSVVSQLSGALHSLTNYSSSTGGSVQSLSDLGLSFDANGHLQLDTTVFNAAATASLSGVMSFLGSASGNSGFLGAASAALTSVTDSTTGLITTASNSVGTSITNLTTKISSEQDRVTLLQKNLTAQMAAADAAISSLQQQVTQITNLFAAQAQASKSITG